MLLVFLWTINFMHKYFKDKWFLTLLRITIIFNTIYSYLFFSTYKYHLFARGKDTTNT